MTLSALFAAYLMQTGSVPIWVPLLIVLLIILLFWWGLTRNKIPAESEIPAEPEVDEAAEEAAVETTAEVETAEAVEVDDDAADDETPVVEDAVRAEAVIVEAEITPEPDDLKLIEGIGPKIAGILADAGITTFAQLAAADPEQLDQIVREDAGIKIANPASWPEQAALAASGDFDGLEELQHHLVAGRHRT